MTTLGKIWIPIIPAIALMMIYVALSLSIPDAELKQILTFTMVLFL